jgi:RNA polymerase sigma factor (sigma-70 family)
MQVPAPSGSSRKAARAARSYNRRVSSTFRTTRWSVVLDATGAAPSREALEELCGTYWFPLYAFARRQGRTHEEAQDLVQAFFARFVEKQDWNVAPDRGRFRSFLLASMRNFLANERHREHARKRGGGNVLVSIDRDAERRYELEVPDGETPEIAYERRFALELLDRALEELGNEQRRAGKEGQFARLRPLIGGAVEELPYAELAAELATSEGALRVAVHRLRKRFGELVRRAVLDLVEDPAEVEDEIRGLLEVLGR